MAEGLELRIDGSHGHGGVGMGREIVKEGKLISAELTPGMVLGLRDYLRNVMIPEGKIIIKTLTKYYLSSYLWQGQGRQGPSFFINFTPPVIFFTQFSFKKSEMIKI